MNSQSMVLDQPSGKLDEVAELVCTTNAPMTVKTSHGDEVKVIPVPKPIRFWKGRPVYRMEDTQYLYLDHPWLLE